MMQGRKTLCGAVPGTFWRLAAVFLLLACLGGSVHGADTDTVKDNQDVRSFYRALQDYFGITDEAEITALREQGLSYDELAVVFFIAERSHAETQRVMEMRLASRTWTEIAFRLGLTPEVFYVPLTGTVTSPPYSHAYKGYSGRPKREWKTISLTEKDVINLVNLRFLSDNYDCPPERVIEMRAAGKTFLQINDALRATLRG
jgi:hypothetical protein